MNSSLIQKYKRRNSEQYTGTAIANDDDAGGGVGKQKLKFEVNSITKNLLNINYNRKNVNKVANCCTQNVVSTSQKKRHSLTVITYNSEKVKPKNEASTSSLQPVSSCSSNMNNTNTSTISKNNNNNDSINRLTSLFSNVNINTSSTNLNNNNQLSPLATANTLNINSSKPSTRKNSYNLNNKIKNKRSKSAPLNEIKDKRIRLNLESINKKNLQVNCNINNNYNNANRLPSTTTPPSTCICCGHQITNNYINVSLQDQLIRRTNFSRRNYGSLELLFTLDREGIIQNIGKFRIENGDSQECLNTTNTIHLENPESQTRWYFKYFLGRLHQNYLVEDKNHNVNFLSVVITDANDRHISQYKVILWTKQGSQKLTLSYQQNKQITVKQILSRFQIEVDKNPKEIFAPEIQRELLILEEQEGSVNFKFGIVYAKNGQLTDDEMLSNESGSPEFEKFINLLGDKVKLKGWKRYRGGLDTTSDTTGEYSIYTIYEGHEIMFHVSTLLPFTRDSKQQLERKRHIGNDIVTIVFQDLDENQEPDFTPSSARSQFQHIFALVTYKKSDNSYRLRIYSEQSVPPFGPSLPSPPIFSNHQEFREFLLVKLINGEKSAFNNTVFGKRRKRTIEAIINSLYTTYEKDCQRNKPNVSSGGFEAITDAFIPGNRKKEEQRKAEFLMIGQKLKLQTILKGDAPTSQITTGVIKREVWEPHLFLQSFDYSIMCSDSWNDWLIVGTTDGVFLLDEAIPWDIKELFDKSVVPRQLNICESYGLMIMLLEKGRIHVFRLSEFNQIISDSDPTQLQSKTKLHCKDRKIDIINGCTLYAINQQSCVKNDSLRIAALCGKKVIIVELKQPNANVLCNMCLNSSSNIPIENEVANYFKLKKEINCSEMPQLINLIEAYSGNNYIILGYKNKCELIDEANGDCLRQFYFNSLSNIKSIVELYDGDQLELLVTFNSTSEFVKLEQPSSPSTTAKSYFSFQWNSEPNFVLCIFPYVIGFAHQCIEIRLLVNGNLVNSITMSNITLLASKKDIIFSADPENYKSNEFSLNEKNVIPLVSNVTNTIAISDEPSNSPPNSPNHSNNVQESHCSHSNINNNSSTINLSAKAGESSVCTIYKISLDFLIQSNGKTNDKFIFTQLCEDSTRTIQREINSSNFIMSEEDPRLSVYHKIITPAGANEDNENTNTNTADIVTEQEPKQFKLSPKSSLNHDE